MEFQLYLPPTKIPNLASQIQKELGHLGFPHHALSGTRHRQLLCIVRGVGTEAPALSPISFFSFPAIKQQPTMLPPSSANACSSIESIFSILVFGNNSKHDGTTRWHVRNGRNGRTRRRTTWTATEGTQCNVLPVYGIWQVKYGSVAFMHLFIRKFRNIIFF